MKVHIRNILRKLDVRSRVAATVMYLEHKVNDRPPGQCAGALMALSSA